MNFHIFTCFQLTVNLDEAMHHAKNFFNLRVRSQASSVTMTMPIERFVRLQTLNRDTEALGYCLDLQPESYNYH